MKTVSATPLQGNPVLQFLQCSVLRTTHHNIPALEGIINVIVIIDFLTFLFTAVNNISALDRFSEKRLEGWKISVSVLEN